MKRIVLIAGSSHTGKTALAQQILERYGYPYLSIDHLQMGVDSKRLLLSHPRE